MPLQRLKTAFSTSKLIFFHLFAFFKGLLLRFLRHEFESFTAFYGCLNLEKTNLRVNFASEIALATATISKCSNNNNKNNNNKMRITINHPHSKESLMRAFTMSLIMLAIMLLCAICLSSCYNDDDIKSDISDLQGRVTALEDWQKSVNSDISSLQTIVNALQTKNYISSVDQLTGGVDIVSLSPTARL